jgi:RTX calcium-binding nonapeptide repeat (4 copies)
VEQGREKIHARRRTLYTTALIVAAVLVACVVVLLAVSQKAEAVFPGKNGRIDLSRDVSVPKKCEAERPSVCRGTQNDDYISGTPDDDTIKSLAGRDYVLGRDGDDTAFGGPGNDTIQGADGRDYLYGEEGGDSLFGGVGPDVIYPAQGEDEVQAGDGDDRIYAPHDGSADRISCGKGDDRVVSGKEDHIAKDCEVSRPASGGSITPE